MGKETANGTLAVNTGKFTGRSPQDRFIVKDDYTAIKFGGEISISQFLQKTLTSYTIGWLIISWKRSLC